MSDGADPTSKPASVLVCFAVREETRFFKTKARAFQSVRTLVTGIGAANARRTVEAALREHRPDLVITCGFAGALRPCCPVGTVLFSADHEFGLSKLLAHLGAAPASFHCATRVAISAKEKQALYTQTQCDAVEMESGTIREICRKQGIASATLRVISDTAEEDLPLDFNAMLDDQMRVSGKKLALAIARSPTRIPGLLRLQKNTTLAAQRLGTTLERLLERWRI